MRHLSRILAVLLLAGLVAAGLGVASNAIWMDSASVGDNTFTTGWVDITASPTQAFIGYSGMMPGDSTIQPVTVQNGGSLELRYAVTVSADDDDGKGLRDVLVLTVKAKTGAPCSVFGGPVLYSGSLNPADGKVLGDTSQGEQPGDRTLAAGSSDVLCFKVELPTSVPDEIQGASTTATFTFAAEQTANN
jgi:hypothetical protein